MTEREQAKRRRAERQAARQRREVAGYILYVIAGAVALAALILLLT